MVERRGVSVWALVNSASSSSTGAHLDDMEDRSGTIELVHQLVKLLSGDYEGAGSVHQSHKPSRPKKFNLAMGILGASVRVSQIEDEASVCDALKAFILTSGDFSKATRFSELHIKLSTRLTDSDLRTRLLMLLHMVGRDRRKNKGSDGSWWVGGESNLPLIHGGMESNQVPQVGQAIGDGSNDGHHGWELSNQVRANQVRLNTSIITVLLPDTLHCCQG